MRPAGHVFEIPDLHIHIHCLALHFESTYLTLKIGILKSM